MSHNPVPVPPEQSLVIARSLCLSTLVVRGTLESAVLLANGPDDLAAYADLSNRLSRWLNDQDFTANFTVAELDALSLAPGSWPPAQHEAQQERVEALNVLLWALQLSETFPACDQASLLPDLQPLIGWTQDAVMSPRSEKLAAFPYNGSDLVSGLAQLRPTPALGAQRAAMECWQWRVHVANLERSGTPPPAGQPYGMLVGIAAEEAHAAGAIGRPISNDFPVNGRPFTRLSATDQARCGELAKWRHVALDWLCGYASPWDAVPVAAAA